MKKLLALTLAVMMVWTISATALADELHMATNANFPPYEYYDGETIVGIDAEVAKAIADKLGMDLVIDDMEFGAIIVAVQTGKADMGMAGMTVTEERLQSINFTDSYATGIQSIIVKEGSAITSVDDLYLEGKDWQIGTQEATTGAIYAADDFDGKTGTVYTYKNGADAVAALVAGKLDCVIIDNQPAMKFVEANEGLVILETAYAVEDYAICIAKDNTELLEKVNAALNELIADGTVQAIVDKYISAE